MGIHNTCLRNFRELLRKCFDNLALHYDKPLDSYIDFLELERSCRDLLHLRTQGRMEWQCGAMVIARPRIIRNDVQRSIHIRDRDHYGSFHIGKGNRTICMVEYRSIDHMDVVDIYSLTN